MWSQLVARGLQDVSSASCLEHESVYFLEVEKSSMATAIDRELGLTVVSLSNSILNTSALCKIGDLGPVLIWIRRRAECTAHTVVGRALCCGSRGGRVLIALSRHVDVGNSYETV